MEESIKKFIIQLIEKNEKLPSNIDIDSFDYIESGYVDSMGLVKFIVNIETFYGIELTDSDIESSQFKTIGGLVSIIDKKNDK